VPPTPPAAALSSAAPVPGLALPLYLVADTHSALAARDLPFSALLPPAVASDLSPGVATLSLTSVHNIQVVERYYTPVPRGPRANSRGNVCGSSAHWAAACPRRTSDDRPSPPRRDSAFPLRNRRPARAQSAHFFDCLPLPANPAACPPPSDPSRAADGAPPD